MIEIGPAAGSLAALVAGIRDDQLGAPTPCADTSVADLLDHVDGLSVAFALAAAKAAEAAGQGPSADGSRLGSDWRQRIPTRLSALAAAWRPEAAWSGTTGVAGLHMPAEVVAAVAVNELIVHGWDLAQATGQPFSADPGLVELALNFVEPAVAASPEGTPGLFGPPVPVSQGSSPLKRLISLTGRRATRSPRPVEPASAPPR